MTDIPIGSPMHRAMQQREEAQRSAGLLGWLFSRDEAARYTEICGPLRVQHERGAER